MEATRATVGLCDYLSVSAHHNTHTMHKCHSYMDLVREIAVVKICNRMGEIVDKELNVFHIETALNNRMYGGPLAYLGRPETTWSQFDRAKFRRARLARALTRVCTARLFSKRSPLTMS